MAKKADDPKFCRYGAWYLSRICREFHAEMGAVKTGTDIDAVHRMRVASRRLRAGLSLFSPCFSKDAYRKISKGVRRITRDLGDARDLDVQMGYLQGLIVDHQSGEGKALDGCRMLLSRTREKRKALQPKVIADCMRLEEKGIVPLLEKEIAAWKKPESPSGEMPTRGFPLERSGRAITRRVRKLLSYSPVVQDPEAVQAHHAMRIAAKRLRYLLEVYAPLYKKEFRPVLRRLKTLQEILGNLHDCDVWIANLEVALCDVHDSAVEWDPVLRAGMAFVLADRKRARDEYYLCLRAEWEGLVASGLFSGLLETVSGGGRR